MNMENQRTLTATMTLGRKIGLLIDHLQAGGEVKIDGYTWVWLDNYVTRTTTNENDETTYWGIDGLAIKSMRISDTEEESPHYMGQGDMSIQAFTKMVGKVTEEDWLDMCASSALRGMNKKR